jgi:uncharacterized Zn finger protein (UPF0148 family)
MNNKSTDESVVCPFCDATVKIKNFRRHRRKHEDTLEKRRQFLESRIVVAAASDDIHVSSWQRLTTEKGRRWLSRDKRPGPKRLGPWVKEE